MVERTGKWRKDILTAEQGNEQRKRNHNTHVICTKHMGLTIAKREPQGKKRLLRGWIGKSLAL